MNRFAFGLPYDEYRAHKSVSQGTLLRIISKSPAHAILDNNKDTPALRLGRMIHCMILEPHKFNDEYHILPADAPKRGTKAFSALTEGVDDKEIVTHSAHHDALLMYSAILNNDCAMDIMDGADKEVSCFWKDEETGVNCKARFDIMRHDPVPIVADLKTTEDASRNGFMSSVVNYRYYAQAAHYMAGYQAVTGIEPEFIFIAVEKSPPYGIGIYKLSYEFITYGASILRQGMVKYAECEFLENWHSYDNSLITLELPASIRKI